MRSSRLSQLILILLASGALLATLAACAPSGAGSPLEPDPLEPTLTITPSPSATIVWFPPTETRTPRPSQPVEATQAVRPALDDVLLNDPLDGQPESAWSTSRSERGSAAFGAGELTLAVHTEKGLITTLRGEPELKDFYLEVQVEPSLCRGEDNYGLLVRAAGEGDGYRFAVTCQGQVRVERISLGRVLPLSEWQQSALFLSGPPDTLTLGLLASEDNFRFYLNDEQQAYIRDPIYPTGKIGFFARSANPDALTVNFSRLMVYAVDPLAARPTPTPTPSPRPSHTRLPSPTAQQ